MMRLRSRPLLFVHALLLVAALCALPALVVSPAIAAPPAWDGSREPRMVRVQLANPEDVLRLLEGGFDIVHREGSSVTLLEWPGDAARFAALGITTELVDARPGERLARRTADERARRPRSSGTRVWSAAGDDGGYRTHVLPPLGSGSLGGFWSPAETRMKLDELIASDTRDLVADKLDTLGFSRKGRPILALRIGATVTGPDPRPVVVMGGLMHAREPIGMQAVFYFADDVLAAYGTDGFATYLLDQRVILLVPVINPDGYAINDSIYTASGGTTFGYWRKNARDNNANGGLDNGDGVDLNRNFANHWGFNNVGSSGSSSSETYRGPSAVSEPESQALRTLVLNRAPRTAISFHSYSDLHLHPWGWTSTGTPDSSSFQTWADEMTLGNGYLSGPATRVLYEVNGEFNDWCYDTTGGKPQTFAWTPEVGSALDDFWPLPSRILPLVQENLRTCYTVAAIAGPYARVDRSTLVEGTLNAGQFATIALRARNLGLVATPPNLRVSLLPLDPSTAVLSGAIDYPTIGPQQSADALAGATFQVAADDTVTPGRLLRFRVDFIADGGYYSRDTIEILCGTPTLLASENAAGTLAPAWLVGGAWGIVSNQPLHPSRYVTDSPSGNYAANANAALTLRAPFDLSHGVHAYALFEARWMIETDFDCTLFEASLDSIAWTPLPGCATVPGLITPQPLGEPVYEGTRWIWRPERVDLSAFAGPTSTRVWLRVRTRSDGGAQYDGFSFDSLAIVIYDPAQQPAAVDVPDPGAHPAALSLSAPRPNPARRGTQFAFVLPTASPVSLDVLDLQGRRVRSLTREPFEAGAWQRDWDLRDAAGQLVPAGVYFARLATPQGTVHQRVLVLH